ncbi:MAG: helix-turn-helix domain-containing protein [Oscillospiraceae bacterium]|nr:helix-turn-helix domain-containing protein [Oscillospiraceae bacterium]
MNGEKFVKVPFGVIETLESKKIKPSSLSLYTVLKKAEFQYCKAGKWFYRAESDLANDTGLSKRTINSAKQELKTAGLIETRVGIENPETHKIIGEKPVTWYHLL